MRRPLPRSSPQLMSRPRPSAAFLLSVLSAQLFAICHGISRDPSNSHPAGLSAPPGPGGGHADGLDFSLPPGYAGGAPSATRRTTSCRP